MGTIGTMGMCVCFVKPLLSTYMITSTRNVRTPKLQIAQLEADTRREEAASIAARQERHAASQERIARLEADTRREEAASQERIAQMEANRDDLVNLVALPASRISPSSSSDRSSSSTFLC